LREKYSGTSMVYVSTMKPISRKKEKIMNYRNCTTDQIS